MESKQTKIEQAINRAKLAGVPEPVIKWRMQRKWPLHKLHVMTLEGLNQ